MRTAVAALCAVLSTGAAFAQSPDTGRRQYELLCSRCHQLDDMITPQVCRSLVAMILTETFDDPAIGALR